MPDRSEYKGWQTHQQPQHAYYSQTSSLTSPLRHLNDVQVQHQQHHLAETQDVNLRLFQHDVQYSILDTYGNDPGGLILSGISYPAAPQWAPDVDIAPPPAARIPHSQDVINGFNTNISSPQGPQSDTIPSQPPNVSPKHANLKTGYSYYQTHQEVQRPGLSRSITAPEAHQREDGAPFGHLPALKRQGTSEDGEDEDFVPSCVDETKVTNRGRKRQRIPHTAVERRYRENLNAHLEKLRLAVPCLASRGSHGHQGESVDGMKPSKCEVLNGAIEHIAALDKEVECLRGDNAVLRARLEEVEGRSRLRSAYAALDA